VYKCVCVYSVYCAVLSYTDIHRVFSLCHLQQRAVNAESTIVKLKQDVKNLQVNVQLINSPPYLLL